MLLESAVSSQPKASDANPLKIIEGELDVIIVSYNTRDLLLNCIEAVYGAEWSGTLRVMVIDNGSTDGTVEAVREHFPECEVIVPGDNLGFARGNNLAMRTSRGEFALLLNPDTVVAPDCFAKTADFLREHPKAGAVTCKLVLPNGKIDLACRRSFPTLWNSFCRASGLSFRFPQSRLFAGYNMTYLPEDQTVSVECICGAYMLVRRQVLDQVGLLDEDYFMYHEDSDWCYRIKDAGWDIYYYPETTTIHYKGQSSNQQSDRMIREFFKGGELFYRKNYFPKRPWVWNMTTLLAVKLWCYTTLLKNALRKNKRVRP